MPSPDKLKQVKNIGLDRNIAFAVARQPNSSRLYLGGSDFKVSLLDVSAARPAPVEIGKHASYVTGVALAGSTLISVGYDGRVNWWDVERKAQVRSVEGHKKWARNVAITSDGRFAATVADDMVCKVWDVASGRQVHELKGHQEKTPSHFPSMLYACAYSADGKFLATGDKVGHVVVWDATTGRQVKTLECPIMYTWDPRQRIHSIGGIRSLAFSPDGKRLAVGGTGKIGNIDHLEAKSRVEVFDWQSGKRTHEFAKGKFNGLVNRLAFHPQGKWLLGAGGAGDGFLAFYDLAGNKVLREEKLPMHVHSVALNETADTVYAVGHGRLTVHEMK